MTIQTVTTIRDVARVAGVSTTTASRVLNGRSTQIPFSATTTSRILAAAAELGYQPNALARGLRGQKTHLLGCLFADMADPFLHLVARAAQSTAQQRSYRFLIADAAENSDEAVVDSVLFSRALVDGVFILGDLLGGAHDWVEYVLAQHRNVVAFGRGGVSRPPAYVGVDNAKGARLLLEHLYGLGHRRVAYLGCERNPDMRVRRATFDAFAVERGLRIPDSYLQDLPLLDYADGYAGFKAVLEAHPRPTAVFASNDRMAIGALRAADEAGVRVPSDLSIVGFDDLGVAAFTHPPLTTIRQPIDKLGSAAVTMLVEMVEGRRDPTTFQQMVFEPELVVRASTASPPEG